ncbi:MAG: Smr/MutS family protein [Bdellovibrionota bacterium]
MFKENQIVFVKTFRKEGRIVKSLNNNYYLVNVGEISIKLRSDALENTPKNINAKSTETISKKQKNRKKDSEISKAYANSIKVKTIDLHGVKAKDLEEIILREISKAILEGYKQINLMHGIGHGVLKNSLPKILDKISAVSHYRETNNLGVMAVYL